MLFQAWSLLLLTAGWSSAGTMVDPIAETPLGELRGHKMTSRGGREFLAFSGVPYAKPPVGQRTLQPPEALERWDGVRDAKENGPWCIQYNLYDLKPTVVGEQDCLYLSVYTHSLKGNAPVLVHFHGGGFISGNGANTGPQYLMDEDVVVVNVNYRLGIFGFLSFEDKDMPGNQGLKDQVMSLKWVQQNIASFGGDPRKVTLVGESAGAGSVYHHTLSPLSKGLFHGAIAQSGSSYGLWCAAPPGFTRNLSIKLLNLLGCSYTNTKDAVACILSKDPKEVAAKLEHFKEWQIDPIFNFGPVLEPPGPGAFITGPISKWHQHSPVPLLIGMDSAEGLLRTLYFPHFKVDYEWFTENFNKLAPTSLLYFAAASDPNKVSNQIRDFYFPSGKITENDWKNLTYMYGDAWTAVATIDGANKHTGEVYFYYYDYLGQKSTLGEASKRNNSLIFGAPHNDELVFLWYSKYVNGFEGEDLKLSQKLVKIWTDFAKHGNPSPAGSGLKWETWSKDRHRYMNIDKNGFNMKEGLIEERYRFWKSINYRDKYD